VAPDSSWKAMYHHFASYVRGKLTREEVRPGHVCKLGAGPLCPTLPVLICLLGVDQMRRDSARSMSWTLNHDLLPPSQLLHRRLITFRVSR